MKRLLTLIALALLPVVGFAQDNGLGRLSEDETGHYTMTMDMGPMKIVSEGWFIDYGARSRTEMVVMGEKVVTIKINDKMYMISPQFREVPSSQTVNFNNLTPDVIEQYDIKKLDKETVDGYECDVYTFQKTENGITADAKVWIWHGLPIRTEVGAGDFTVVQTISNLEVGIPIDPALFELPENK